ncbi:MAG: glycosyl transferase group 1 [Edaphobacter sp.]|nr:glycosyl transferase group 1 [Edaphobacter sp.]
MREQETKSAILSVAYPFATVGAKAVGGAEQMLCILESALVARGFQSVVAAHAASQIAGNLVGAEVPTGVLTPDVRAEVERRLQASIDSAFAHFPICLVHMHGVDFHRYRIPQGVPVLVTLHLPLAWYPPDIWTLPPNFHLQCVSNTQLASCPVEHRGRITVVENGVRIPPASMHRKGRFALLLSRICPEKNLHAALDAARSMGVQVMLAGVVFPYPEHLRYFEQEIARRLGRGARLIGPVGGASKQRLLERARCLLLPTLAEETSSLAAMESLVSGTPVIAFPSGAIPEIVEDGRTGFS